MNIVVVTAAVLVLTLLAAAPAGDARAVHAQSGLPSPTNINSRDTVNPGEVVIT